MIGRYLQQVSYDTQFNVVSMYASTLTLRDVRILGKASGSPMIIPVFLVLHDRKFQADHALAFDYMVNLIPELKTKHFLATSDQEFTDLLESKLEKATVGVCENHVSQTLGHWVRDNLGQSKVSAYKAEFRASIREETREMHDVKIQERSARWDPRFKNYWYKEIADLVEKVSLWKANEIKWGGMTDKCICSSNQSESFNHILRYKTE